MNNQEISPNNSMEHVLRHWWVVVALMVAGGLVGFLFLLFLRPVYEAKAYIAINLDYAKRQLTQIEKDHAFNAAGDIINSNSIMNLVISDAKVKGYSITPSRFRRDFYLEGRRSVWELRSGIRIRKLLPRLPIYPRVPLKLIGWFGLIVLIGFITEGFSTDTFALPYLWVSLGMVSATGALWRNPEEQAKSSF